MPLNNLHHCNNKNMPLKLYSENIPRNIKMRVKLKLVNRAGVVLLTEIQCNKLKFELKLNAVNCSGSYIPCSWVGCTFYVCSRRHAISVNCKYARKNMCSLILSVRAMCSSGFARGNCQGDFRPVV